MKNTIKLSLATAMLVGLVSNATAAVNFEDAIKDVKLKGSLSYTMEKYLDKDGNDNEAQHDIDVRVQADIPVADKYKFTVRIDEANDDDDDKNPNDGDSTDKDSSALELEADQVYVTYKDGAVKVKAGLQKVIAPRLHDSVNGDGFAVAYKASKDLTISGGYFYTTEKTGTDEVAGLAINGDMDVINYGLTYATVIDSDQSNGNDGSTGDNGAKVVDLTLNTKVSGFNLGAAYTQKSYDVSTKEDQKLLVVNANGKFSGIKVGVAIASVGASGGAVSIDEDSDAGVNLVLDSVSTNDLADATAIYVMASGKLSKTTSLKAEYVTADGDAGTYKEATEYMITLTEKVNKKLKMFAKYNAWETIKQNNTVDDDRVRVTFGTKYSF